MTTVNPLKLIVNVAQTVRNGAKHLKLVSMKPGTAAQLERPIAQLKMELAHSQKTAALMLMKSGVFTRINVFQLMISVVLQENSNALM